MAVATEVDLSPGSEAWSRLVSASKVPAILGLSPWASPLSTWYEMKGLIERENVSSGAMVRGNLLEDAILNWWLHHKHEGEEWELSTQVTRWHEDWGIATLDGLAVDPVGMHVGVEAKSTSKWDGWGQEGTDQIPQHYKAQVWWQFICAPEVDTIYVPVLGPFLDFREYVLHRNELEVDLGLVLERVKAFYDSLAGDEPPPLDDHKATVATFVKLNRDIAEGQVAVIDNFLAAEYVDAALSLKAAEARERLARANVLKVAGNAQYVDSESGVRIARRQATQRGVSLYRQAKSVPPVV
jgi:putative phage-type endonuclease